MITNPSASFTAAFACWTGTRSTENTGGQIGSKCNATNPELHRGRRVMPARKKTICKTNDMGRVRWGSYGVPVDGRDNHFVHFTNGMSFHAETV